MAEPITLARPYARAAFEIARESKALGDWDAFLSEAALVAQYEKVDDLLSSPSLTSEQKAAQFVSLFGETFDSKRRNFVAVLAENHRLNLLPYVFELFALYKAEFEKTVDVEVFTAFEIDAALEEKLAQTLKTKLERDVALSTQVDESLIGGALIRAGDTVIDGSARARLDKLADALRV